MGLDNSSHTQKIIIKQLIYLLAADVLYSLALNLFYVGNNIAAGGLAGIGTIVNSLFPIPVGVTVFILNLPIVFFGIKIKGKRYVLISVAATGLFSVVVDLLSFLPCVTDDKLVAAICGGILYGTAAFLTSKAQISSGGTDLLARILITKFKSTSLGKLYLCIDGFIVIMAMVAYKNIELGIYAIMAISVCSIVTDKLNTSFNEAIIFYIFTSKPAEEMANVIMSKMNRGATLLKGIGMYAQTEKDVLLVVVKPSEIPIIKKIVKTHDPDSFVIESQAREIIGNGFENIDLTTTINE